MSEWYDYGYDYAYGQQGGVIETVRKTAHETLVRLANTIDAFRPKIIFKKNLSDLPIVQKGILGVTGLDKVLTNIEQRVQEMRERLRSGGIGAGIGSGVGGGTGGAAPSAPQAPSGGAEQAAQQAREKASEKASGLVIEDEEGRKTFLY